MRRLGIVFFLHVNKYVMLNAQVCILWFIQLCTAHMAKLGAFLTTLCHHTLVLRGYAHRGLCSDQVSGSPIVLQVLALQLKLGKLFM